LGKGDGRRPADSLARGCNYSGLSRQSSTHSVKPLADFKL
jgi:hypothetical protein